MKFYNTLLKNFRQGRGLTLDEVGRSIGISKQTVAKWESGQVVPRPANVHALANLFHISVADISDLKPEKWITDRPDVIIPEDHAFEEVLKAWPKLSNSERLKVAALAVELVEKSSEETAEENMDRDCPECHAKAR